MTQNAEIVAVVARIETKELQQVVNQKKRHQEKRRSTRSRDAEPLQKSSPDVTVVVSVYNATTLNKGELLVNKNDSRHTLLKSIAAGSVQ